MAKEKMSEAEKYRLERKKRIEKEKKKKNSYFARNHQQVQKAKKVVGITVGVIAAVAVLCLLLNYFGVFNRIITAATVDGKRISVAQMNCAYTDVKNQAYNASQQYEESYGQGFYTSDTKSTDSCIYDSSKTWGEYFEEQALEHAKNIYTFKDEEGNTLTDEQQKDITETFSSLAENAQSNGFSLNAYIREVYGIGVNKKVLRTWLENFYKAQNAQEAIQTTYEKSLTDDQIKQYYKENKANYTTASIKYHTISVDTSALSDAKEDISNKEIDKLIAKANKSAKKDADKLAQQISANPSAFVSIVNKYEKKANPDNYTEKTDEGVSANGVISQKMSSLGADAQKWVANSKMANQVKVVYTADYDNKSFQYDIILIVEPASNYYTVNVRHILVQPSDTESDEAWEEAKEKVQSIYKQWKKKGTEEYFSTLAGEKTDDSGSKETGGLYENVTPGQMVDTFDAWCFDASRKPGDNGIVKTTYGYHIIYFVSNNGAYWKTQVPTDMATEHLNTTISDMLEPVKVEKVSFGWNRIKSVQDYKADQKLTTTTAAAEETADAQ